MQKKELQTTRLVSLKLAKNASTRIDKRKGGKNYSLDISYNLENLKNSPKNKRTQKELMHCVKINLHYFFNNKNVPFDDVESIIQDTCKEAITKVIAGKEMTEGIIRNFAKYRHIDIVKSKNRKKRINNELRDIKTIEVNDKPIEHFEIRDMLQLLPKDEARIIQKLYFGGHNLFEISNSEMKSPSTIHRYHKKALKRLKKFL